MAGTALALLKKNLPALRTPGQPAPTQAKASLAQIAGLRLPALGGGRLALPGAAPAQAARGGTYSYTDAQVEKKISSDKKRTKNITDAFNAHDLATLQMQAQGAATGDARNYAELELSRLTGQPPVYVHAHGRGSSLGDVAKKVGGVVSAPLRAIGHGLATSGIPLVSNVGAAAEHVGNAVAGKGAFLRELGKAGESAAPVVGLIPGVGTLAGAAIGAGGAALDRGTKLRLADAAKYGGEGALSGFANEQLLGGKGVGGIADLVKGAGHTITGALPGGGGASTAASGATAATGAKGLLGKVAGYVAKNPLKAAQIATTGLGVLQGAKAQGRSDQLIQRALSGVGTPAAPPDLSSLFNDPNNPYGGGGGTSRSRRAALASLASGGF